MAKLRMPAGRQLGPDQNRPQYVLAAVALYTDYPYPFIYALADSVFVTCNVDEDIDNDDGWPCCHNGVCAKELPG